MTDERNFRSSYYEKVSLNLLIINNTCQTKQQMQM